MTFFYSPYTFELIATTTPADWMGRTDVQPPAFDAGTQYCLYQDGAWVVAQAQAQVQPQATPVPGAVSMRQARTALLSAGLLSTVSAAVEALDGIEGDVARIEWEYAQEVRRDSPLVASMASALGMTDAQLDGLFVRAAAL